MLEFNVNNQIITRMDDFGVVADSIDYLKIQFTMTDEWTDGTVAVFCGGGEAYHQVLTDKGCTVPPEVIKAPGFTVSLFCGDKGLVTANAVWVEAQPSGLCAETAPSQPTLPLWQQYIEKMHLLIESGLPCIGENKNWFIFDPDLGEYKDTGIRAEGKIPVKGTDYWTKADKIQMVSDVLAALPDADTMSFPLEETVSEVSEE